MLMKCTDAIPSIQPSWLPGMSNFPSFLYLLLCDAEVGLTPAAAQLLARNHKDELAEWMDQDLREWMGDTIPDDVRFGSQAGQVFKSLAGDFMLDVLDDVDAVLATGGG